MKYQGKYRAYIGLIMRDNINRCEIIQLGTMTPREAKKSRKDWHIIGFDWIIWRKPTKKEIEIAKKTL